MFFTMGSRDTSNSRCPMLLLLLLLLLLLQKSKLVRIDRFSSTFRSSGGRHSCRGRHIRCTGCNGYRYCARFQLMMRKVLFLHDLSKRLVIHLVVRIEILRQLVIKIDHRVDGSDACRVATGAL
uniref:Putative secreted protein n=1 Tax=Anopheles darlingi TaxID=43151 RepID=A0A2M4D6I4_ANODA